MKPAQVLTAWSQEPRKYQKGLPSLHAARNCLEAQEPRLGATPTFQLLVTATSREGEEQKDEMKGRRAVQEAGCRPLELLLWLTRFLAE